MSRKTLENNNNNSGVGSEVTLFPKKEVIFSEEMYWKYYQQSRKQFIAYLQEPNVLDMLNSGDSHVECSVRLLINEVLLGTLMILQCKLADPEWIKDENNYLPIIDAALFIKFSYLNLGIDVTDNEKEEFVQKKSDEISKLFLEFIPEEDKKTFLDSRFFIQEPEKFAEQIRMFVKKIIKMSFWEAAMNISLLSKLNALVTPLYTPVENYKKTIKGVKDSITFRIQLREYYEKEIKRIEEEEKERIDTILTDFQKDYFQPEQLQEHIQFLDELASSEEKEVTQEVLQVIKESKLILEGDQMAMQNLNSYGFLQGGATSNPPLLLDVDSGDPDIDALLNEEESAANNNNFT